MSGPAATDAAKPGRLRRSIGLALGPLVFAAMVASPPPEGLGPDGWAVAATGVLMAVWWVAEALPLPATALLPVVLFPALGVMPVGSATAPYANPLIFLFLGGFAIALAMERWGLHRRIALGLLRLVGARQDRLVGGFMGATAFLSMWISNTASTVLMLPIALSVIHLLLKDEPGERPDETAFPTALLLGVAYGASVGGLGTLIGTPPNALLAGFMAETYGIEIGFGEWMMLGLPLVAVMLAAVWGLLTRVVTRVPGTEIPGARAAIDGRLAELGPPGRGEIMVAAVFATTAALWIFRPLVANLLPGILLHDSVIAIAAAVALFALPVRLSEGVFLLDWESARRLPWGVLLLFGGGLSLAAGVTETGLAAWLAAGLGGLGAWPTVALVLAVTALIVLLTELTSNTATAATFLPIVGALAVSIGASPLVLAVPAALGASCAFMMPVATPPNAIVFGSGHVALMDMVRAGVWLNLAAILIITGLVYGLMFGALGLTF